MTTTPSILACLEALVDLGYEIRMDGHDVSAWASGGCVIAWSGDIGDAVRAIYRELVQEPRTWTGRQLSRALAERGIELGPRQIRRYLRRMGAKYRRTAQTLKHKQDPAKAERAGRVLDNLEARAAAE